MNVVGGGCVYIKSETFSHLASLVPNLTQLTLCHCCNLSFDDLALVLKMLKQLHTLKLSGCDLRNWKRDNIFSSLQHLSLDGVLFSASLLPSLVVCFHLLFPLFSWGV
eukprot:TRINITY_DN30991_c0_g1_i1.p1 TRINITY_DN30991_c0_g1~~TRINITY_DN30991_c0_g1_i1.p1  ORF type:complete len:108 (+),score=21.35 TRINITY_DN30991_c0_g1_i1:235-558(+)